MAQSEHLDKAPIVEAVLDIFVSGVRSNVEDLQTFHAEVEDRFPLLEKRRQFKGIIDFDEAQPSSSASVDHIGWVIRSSDSKDIVQARTDGFSVNRMSPYREWADLRRLGMELYPIYRKIAQPDSVTRLGLRFINQFDIGDGHAEPPTLANLKRYLRWRPAEIEGFENKTIDGFLLRTIFNAAADSRAIVTMAQNQAGTEPVSFVLDIEVFRLGLWAVDAPEIWSTLDELRDLKNKLFFSSITDTLKERFK